MDSERWQRIKAVVADTMERPIPERAEFVALACGNDTSLRREVESLLSQSHETLDRCAAKIAAPSLETDQMIGARLGAYEVLSEIGRGGMGAVYLARRADETFEKEVAIKLLKRGTDTDEVLRRFRAERQILARLEHPNIARLIDAGTTGADLPYFVMEYVQGAPITQFCGEHRLNTRQRIQLILQVCRAVQFAHQNLVVHRDLKPGNILVTPEGVPKLLDFGIAKLLSDDSQSIQVTLDGAQRLTPGYASPEQVRGEAVTTATDVYSLGALLYELLAGHTPHRFATPNPSPTELLRVIGEQEISRTDLPRDLDNILRTALRKEPERRYSGVSAFADDLQRYLDGRPVRAAPATLGYRASKFIARNKLAVAAAILLLATLLGGIAATSWQARKAQRRFEEVRKFARMVMFDYHDLIEPLAGATPVRERLVRDALEYLNNLARDAGDDASLLRELATAYCKIGHVQGNSYHSNLGDTDGAMQSYRISLAIREKLLAASPRDPELQAETADSHEGLGDVLYTRGDLRAGLESYERAVTLYEAAYRSRAGDPTYAKALASLYVKAGDVRGGEFFTNLGDTAGALENYGKALELLEPFIASRPQDMGLKFEYGNALAHGALLALSTGDAAGALRDMRRTVQLAEEKAAAEPENQGTRSDLLTARYYLHFALVDNNLTAEAIELSRSLLAEEEKSAAADPKNQMLLRSLGLAHNKLGMDLVRAGQAGEAIEHHRRALAISEAALAVDPDSEDSRVDVALTMAHLGRAQAAHGEHAAALPNFRRALALREATMTADPSNARAREDVAAIHQDIGKSLAQSNDPAGAIAAFAKSIPLAEELLRQSPMRAFRQARLAGFHFDAGKVYRQRAASAGPTAEEDRRQAREHFSRSLSLWQDLRDRNALVPANVAKLQEVERAAAETEAASR
jgi:tetratricopeptide (TPR) repeat protein